MFQYESDPLQREEKFELPADLPASYHQDILVLMIRDPQTAFLYWDLKASEEKQTEEAPAGQYYIKIYKGSSGEFSSGEAVLHQEFPIMGGTRSCYFTLDDNYDTYHAILEYVPFFEEPLPVAQSNIIVPPKGSNAAEFDREWKSIEKIYRKFYSLVKKELKTDTSLSEILAEEDIEELEALQDIDEIEELGDAVDLGETEELEETEESENLEESVGRRKKEDIKEHRRTRKAKIPVEEPAGKETVEGEKVKKEPPGKEKKQAGEKMKRRQELLRRIVSAYLEKRALPGGIYAPAIPPPQEPRNQEKDK